MNKKWTIRKKVSKCDVSTMNQVSKLYLDESFSFPRIKNVDIYFFKFS